MDIYNQRDFAYLPYPPFFRGQWDYSEGGTRRWKWNRVHFEGLCPPGAGFGRHTQGDPAQAGSGPSWQLAAIKCCLPVNNVFKMVIAGHVGLSRDRSWPRLLTRNSYRLPVSATAACVLSGRGREQGALKVHFRCRPWLSGCDLRAVTHSATLRRPCAWLLLEFLMFVRTWRAVYPTFSYIYV